jgi:hypothetical protein
MTPELSSVINPTPVRLSRTGYFLVSRVRMNLQHHFLIAMPALQDPFFKRSVVYICEHNEEGAMGLIVNKPMENLTVEGILKKLKISDDWRSTGRRSWLYPALCSTHFYLQYSHL